MTTPTRNNIRSTRRMALLLTLASVATGATFVSTVLALPGAAHAATTEALPSETVHYHDLDLASERGVTKLHMRIHRAAKRVCGDTGYPPMPRLSLRRTCLEETKRNAYAQADQKIAQYRVSRLAKD